MKKILLVLLTVLLTFAMIVSSVSAASESDIPDESSAVSDESSAPVEESSAPVEESSAPAEESSAPIEESSVPADETSAPTDETSAPADESAIAAITKAIVDKAKENGDELKDFVILYIKLDGASKSIVIDGRYTQTVEKNGKEVDEFVVWNESYEIKDELYLELFGASGQDELYSAYAADAVLTNESAAKIVEIINPAPVELEFKGFGDEGLSRNLKYMGLGMLGIFVVVGVVILLTFVLNASTSKKK